MKCQTRSSVSRVNDALRRALVPSRYFKLVLTVGVSELAMVPLNVLLDAVRGFESFSPSNDPYGEHDFGKVMVDGKSYFWKFDYYDEALELGRDPKTETCVRVLTIMRADEYFDMGE